MWRRNIDIGVDGILNGSQEVVDGAVTEWQQECTRAEQYAEVQKAIAGLSLAWKVLHQDVEASSFRYVPYKTTGETVLKPTTINRLGASMVTYVAGGALERFELTPRPCDWGGADDTIRVEGPSAEDMTTSHYDFDDDGLLYGNRASVDRLLASPDSFAAGALVTRSNLLVSFLLKPAAQREHLQKLA